MAFEFLGTFNKSQFDRVVAFARSQTGLIDARIAHLEAEIRRVGALDFAYDADGVPTGYTVSKPADSYLAKLVGAYEALGGDALYDLNIRSIVQPVFVIKADESSPAQRMSSGEIIGQPGLNDANSAERMRQIRIWLDDTLQYRREYLERKIRRMVDYSDSLRAETTLLTAIQLGADVSGSLEFVIAKIQDLMSDRTYQAVSDDKGADPHGHKMTAPLAAYPAGPNRPDAVSDQRTFDGFEPATETEG